MSTVYEGPARSASHRSTDNPASPSTAAADHGHPLRGARHVPAPLERLLPRRHEPQLLEPERLGHRLRRRSGAPGGSGRTTRPAGRSSTQPPAAGQILSRFFVSGWYCRSAPHISAASSR